MPLNLHIHPGDDVPIYRQLVRQVEAAVITGRVMPGERLPSQRELAKELVIAPLTVKRAYDELENTGFLRMERGRGTFACSPPRLEAGLAEVELKSAANRLLELAWQHDIPLEKVMEILAAQQRNFPS